MSDQQLRAEILEVLGRALTGTKAPAFLTPYQVLQRLPEVRRDALTEEYCKPGKGAGKHYSAASRIGHELDSMFEQGAAIDKAWFDTSGTKFEVGDGEHREAGAGFVSLYRKA